MDLLGNCEPSVANLWFGLVVEQVQKQKKDRPALLVRTAFITKLVQQLEAVGEQHRYCNDNTSVVIIVAGNVNTN